MLNVKNNFKHKHLVLKKLFEKWQKGEERTNNNIAVTELGRSLSVLELISSTKLYKTQVDLILIYLSSKGLIKILTNDSDKSQKNHKWIITDLGKEFHVNNHFLNERGFFYRKLVFEVLSLFFAFVALIFSIWNASQNSSLEQRLNNHDQELQQLKHK